MTLFGVTFCRVHVGDPIPARRARRLYAVKLYDSFTGKTAYVLACRRRGYGFSGIAWGPGSLLPRRWPYRKRLPLWDRIRQSLLGSRWQRWQR